MTQRYLVVSLALLLSIAVIGAPGADAQSAAGSAEPTTASPTDAKAEAYALLMRSILIARRGEFRAAAQEIRRAIEKNPESTALIIEGAELMLWMGRRQEAEELARHAVELDPEDPGSIRFLADLAADRALGNRPDEKSRVEAIRLFDRLVELGAEDAELLRRLISLHLQAGDRQGALEAAERLVVLRPGDGRATELLVRLKADQGKHEDALRYALLYLLRHPEESPLLRLAEELAEQLEAWELVAELLSGENGLADQPVAAQRLRAEALIRLNRVSEATQAWEGVLARDPSNRRVRFALATAYRRIGRLADASVLARSLVEESPEEARAHLLYAETLDAQGDEEGALQALATALGILVASDEIGALPVREVIRGRMILLYLSQERPNDAEKLFQELENPDRVESIELAAELAVAREDWNAARQAARRLRESGESGGADLVEAEIGIRTGRWAKAAAKSEEAIAALGPGAAVRLAEIYLEVGKPEPGELLLREWVTRDPQNADAHFSLGSYLYRADDFPGAEAALREAFRLSPEHAPALNFLGYSLAERGERLEEAASLIQRALAVEEWNGAYLDSLGWVLYQMGRYEEARDPLERAAREYPGDPVVLEHLGDLYARLSENSLAVAAWTRALDAGAEDGDQLRAKIDRLGGSPNEAVARSESGAVGSPSEVPREAPPPQP
jgi:tetratricopeptide (TPR) repeat protein